MIFVLKKQECMSYIVLCSHWVWFLDASKLHNQIKYCSVQNEGKDCREPMLSIDYVRWMSTRSSLYIVLSMLCLATLITTKRLNLLRCQTEENLTPLIYLVNRKFISIRYQKHFLRPILVNLTSKEWMKFVSGFILWEGCLCQYHVLVNSDMT